MRSQESVPVRIAGFRGEKTAPLLHTKLLVLGFVYWAEDEGARELLRFWPRIAWWGSVNWTRGAERHIEMGTYSDDEAILEQTARFVGDLIARLSEPLDSTSIFPEPEFAEVEFDDAAFIEYLDEYDEPYEDDEEIDEADVPGADLLGEYGFLPEEGDEPL